MPDEKQPGLFDPATDEEFLRRADGPEASDLTPRKAYELASRLTALTGFPNRDQVIQAGMNLLLKHCESLTEAEWLIEEVLGIWKKWTSFAELVELYNSRFKPAPTHRTFDNFPQSPPIACGECQDTGTKQENGALVWCTCAYAADLREKAPNYLKQAQASLDASSSRTSRFLMASANSTVEKLQRLGCGSGRASRRPRQAR